MFAFTLTLSTFIQFSYNLEISFIFLAKRIIWHIDKLSNVHHRKVIEIHNKTFWQWPHVGCEIHRPTLTGHDHEQNDFSARKLDKFPPVFRCALSKCTLSTYAVRPYPECAMHPPKCTFFSDVYYNRKNVHFGGGKTVHLGRQLYNIHFGWQFVNWMWRQVESQFFSMEKENFTHMKYGRVSFFP